MKDKRIAIAQWVNHLRNNIFVNLPPLPLMCEISGPLHLRYSSIQIECRDSRVTLDLSRVTHQNTRVNRE